MAKPKAVNIKKSVYALASVDGESAELTMYGDIYESRPVDWWTGKEVEGNFILLDEFLQDLNEVAGCKQLTIRMNSYGGDAGVSITIHNRLRELQANGMKITCVVDGVAMSGGSLIMCACDTVRVNPSSLVMIHKCISLLWGYYNADEMREAAESNDAYDKAQVEIYQRKTSLSATVISHMMADSTYMTGREAKEKGFADELIEDAEPLDIAASADGRFLFARGHKLHLSASMVVPNNIPTVTPEASAAVETNKTPVVTGKEEEENSMTVKELREKYPDEVAQVEAEARAAVDTTEAAKAAVAEERKRMAEIDEVASLFDPAIVKEAKYGEKPCSAADMTLRAAKAAAEAGSKFLADAKEDSEKSGANGVPATPGKTEEDPDKADTPEAKMENARASVKALFGSKKEG